MSEITQEVLDKPQKRRRGFYRYIQHSIEFYLGDANLRHDSYMKKILNQGPDVDPAIFLSFNRICSMGADVNDILKAVTPSKTLEVTSDSKIRRRLPIVEKTKENVDWCSIYVENIPPDCTTDDLLKIFGAFGKVAKVTIPKLRFKGKIAGFAFVEFDDFHSRMRALQAFRTYGAIINNNRTTSSSAIHEIDADVEKQETAHVQKLELLENAKKENEANQRVESSTELELTIPPSRKNRKKKIRGKLKFMGVQIMSKTAWNILRNRYLTLQAFNRRRLKAQLTKLKRSPPHRPKFKTLVPGSIVLATLPKPATDSDVLDLRAKLRQMENVEYVDVEVGQNVCHVRMSSAEAATALLSTSDVLPECQLSILPSSKEADYFSEIQRHRREKFSKGNPAKTKLSGKKKILARAERQLCFKIRVSGDEPLHI